MWEGRSGADRSTEKYMVDSRRTREWRGSGEGVEKGNLFTAKYTIIVYFLYFIFFFDYFRI